MCRIFGVSRTGYCVWLKRPKSRRKIWNRELLKKIRKIHKISRGTYSSPRIARALKKEGITYSRNWVVRLMRENGIVARTKRKYKGSKRTVPMLPMLPLMGDSLWESAEIDQILFDLVEHVGYQFPGYMFEITRLVGFWLCPEDLFNFGI